METMALYFDSDEMLAIEAYSPTIQHFIANHCTTSDQPAAPLGDSTCPICLEELDPQDSTIHVLGDPSDAGCRLVRSNDKCVHVYHVGCVDAWSAVSGRCPKCRCIWFGEAEEQDYISWVAMFLAEMEAGSVKVGAYVVEDDLITVHAPNLHNLIKLIACFLSSRGIKPGSGFEVAGAVANTTDGYLLVEAMMAYVSSIDGKMFDKSQLLIEWIPRMTVRTLRASDGINDHRPLTIEMMEFVEVVSQLVHRAYSTYFA